jgi:hypothetical protein
MTHPFENDPFSTLMDVWSEMFPNFPVPLIQWTDEFDIDDHKGECVLPDDGSEIVVSVSVQCPVANAVEVLAHELAHAACYHLGLGHPDSWEDHVSGESGQHWRAIFDELHRRHVERIEMEEKEDC